MHKFFINKDRSREINSFLKSKPDYYLSYTWDWIVRQWYNRLQELGTDPRELFIKKKVCGKPLVGYTVFPDLTWGQIKAQSEYGMHSGESAEDKHVELQEDLDNEPDIGINSYRPWDQHNYPDFRYFNKGELLTLNYLWTARDKLDFIFAILVQASERNGLSKYIETSGYDGSHLDLLRIVWDVSNKFKIPCGWHHWSSSALPEPNIWPIEKGGYLTIRKKRVRSFRALIRTYADHHGHILKYYRPVCYERVEQRIPELDKLISELNIKRAKEKKAEHQRREKLWAENEKAREKSKKLRQEKILEHKKWLKEKRAKHPRFDDWEALTKEELEELVWTKPITQVANDFGYSDVAISKKCKKLQIKKPPVGFWRKVETGKIPHPEGKPTNL